MAVVVAVALQLCDIVVVVWHGSNGSGCVILYCYSSGCIALWWLCGMVVVVVVVLCHVAVVVAAVVMSQWSHGIAVVAVVAWCGVSGGGYVMVVIWQVVVAHCGTLSNHCITLWWQQ